MFVCHSDCISYLIDKEKKLLAFLQENSFQSNPVTKGSDFINIPMFLCTCEKHLP